MGAYLQQKGGEDHAYDKGKDQERELWRCVATESRSAKAHIEPAANGIVYRLLLVVFIHLGELKPVNAQAR
jgi:hypothetical protein